MKAADIPTSAESRNTKVLMRDLLYRAAGPVRTKWLDLPKASGIYIVSWASADPIEFTSTSGGIGPMSLMNIEELQDKWNRIQQMETSDVLYVGKANSIRNRLRQLALFGVGLARNHKGGEWIWQVKRIEQAEVSLHTCPSGYQDGFENWILEEYHRKHGEYPVANRCGPRGEARWHPLLNQ